MQQSALSNFLYPGLLWPALLAEASREINASFAKQYIEAITGPLASPATPQPEWATPNEVALELQTVRLRDFSAASDGISRSNGHRAVANNTKFSSRQLLVPIRRQAYCPRIAIRAFEPSKQVDFVPRRRTVDAKFMETDGVRTAAIFTFRTKICDAHE
jgi:hypothetical protein